MKRWMAWIALAVCVVLLALLLGCSGGDGTEPSPVPRVGRYNYDFSARGLAASGVMVVSFASADSIAGHFEVAGYEARMALGFWNMTAFVVYGFPDQGGIVQHRLAPDAAGFFCSAKYHLSVSDIRTGSCDVTYVGP